MIFEKIKQEIMADQMNESYTKMGIMPLFKASVDARIVMTKSLYCQNADRRWQV